MREMRVPGGTSRQRYQAPEMRLGRSQFDLSHNHKTTFDASVLVPYFVQEVVPGDTMTCKLTGLARIFSPLDAPVMDNISVELDYFFVPNRILWSHWDDMLGAHDAAGAQDTDYTVPILSSGYTVVSMSEANYMGVPIGLSTTSEDVSALPFRATIAIYNEWYRDQNLIDPLTLSTGDGPDNPLAGVVGSAFARKSAKKHDYFTSALPYLQKGDAQVAALEGTAVVRFTDVSTDIGVWADSVSGIRKLQADNTTNPDEIQASGAAGQALYIDLEDVVGGVNVNVLREYSAIQRLLERDARGGTRLPELIRAHFGVDVPDYRVQRPEYLGGGRGYINVTPVANTSATATEDQGQLAGVGTGVLKASFAKSFVEHGWVIGILRARGDITYQQGLDRMWSRSTKYDFLWPELAQLGEQAILNKELWIEGDSTDDDVFGYQERYAEYRYKKSLVTGNLASDAPSSIDFWHLAEDFGSQPSLNQTFVEDATPMSRVTTVDSQPDFIIDGRFDFKVARALPVRPNPTLATARF